MLSTRRRERKGGRDSLYGNEFLESAGLGRWARWTAVAAAVVVLVIAVAWAPWRATASTGPSTAGSSPAMSSGPATVVAGSGGGVPVEVGSQPAAGQVVDDLPAAASVAALPRGHRVLVGFRVGYPRTTSGAVAAAVEYVSHAGCLTTACVDAMMRAGIDPSWQGARAHLLAGMAENRRILGIPERSPVPAGAVMTATAMAFQIVPVSASSLPGGDDAPRIRVVLLCYLAMAGPAISPRNAVIAVPVTLRWNGADFKQIPGDRSYPELVVRPGTPRAVQLGWRELIA